MKLWQWGLIIALIAGFLNGQLVSHNIGGIVRELMRLAALVGLGVLIYGLISKR